MKLFSKNLELKIIKTICSGSKTSGYMLGKLAEDHIHTDAAQSAFRRISAIARKDGEIPSFSLLCEDPTLSDSVRTTLRDFDKPAFRKSEIEKSIKKIKQFHTLRGLLQLSENIVEQLSNDGVDVDEVLNDISNKIAQVRSGSIETRVYKFGVGNNTSELLNEIVEGEGISLIPSTIEAWDSVNGGIPITACVLMAATTGGGKSISASSMCKRLSERGYKPGVYSLEMSAKEVASRLIADVCNVPVHKVIRGKKGLTENERKHIQKTFSKWIKEVKENGGSYHLFDVDGSVTVTQALYNAKAYGVDIVVIDYVALLDGMDGDDDWRNLSEAVRQGKKFSRVHGIPVVFLAQLGDDGKLRYSKRMLDDADIAFVWRGDEEAKETGIIHVSTPKSRNMTPINFEMMMDWEYTRMRDLTEDEVAKLGSYSNDDDDDSGKGKRKGSKKKVLRDITSGTKVDI